MHVQVGSGQNDHVKLATRALDCVRVGDGVVRRVYVLRYVFPEVPYKGSHTIHCLEAYPTGTAARRYRGALRVANALVGAASTSCPVPGRVAVGAQVALGGGDDLPCADRVRIGRFVEDDLAGLHFAVREEDGRSGVRPTLHILTGEVCIPESRAQGEAGDEPCVLGLHIAQRENLVLRVGVGDRGGHVLLPVEPAAPNPGEPCSAQGRHKLPGCQHFEVVHHTLVRGRIQRGGQVRQCRGRHQSTVVERFRGVVREGFHPRVHRPLVGGASVGGLHNGAGGKPSGHNSVESGGGRLAYHLLMRSHKLIFGQEALAEAKHVAHHHVPIRGVVPGDSTRQHGEGHISVAGRAADPDVLRYFVVLGWHHQKVGTGQPIQVKVPILVNADDAADSDVPRELDAAHVRVHPASNLVGSPSSRRLVRGSSTPGEYRISFEGVVAVAGPAKQVHSRLRGSVRLGDEPHVQPGRKYRSRIGGGESRNGVVPQSGHPRLGQLPRKPSVEEAEVVVRGVERVEAAHLHTVAKPLPRLNHLGLGPLVHVAVSHHGVSAEVRRERGVHEV